jgi:hypothetical protein
MVEMQVLFVLGTIGETFEVNGLQHFPMDVEASVEKCHRALVKGGCAIFQAGSLLVLVAEVRTRAFLASLVPVIVNAALNEHQIVLDIVAFVAMGDFPRSRLGEKQRGKVLASWVSRKMRTIAQFSIRDAEAEGSVGTTVNGNEYGSGTRPGSMQSNAMSIRKGSSSLRHVESTTNIPSIEPPLIEGEQLMLHTDDAYNTQHHDPYTYSNDRPPQHLSDDARALDNNTPTNNYRPQPHLNTTLDYSPVDPYSTDAFGSARDEYAHPRSSWDAQTHSDSPSSQRRIGSIPSSSQQQQYDHHSSPLQSHPPHLDFERRSVSPVSPILEPPPRAGGLRIANASEGESDWAQEALQTLNLKGK